MKNLVITGLLAVCLGGCASVKQFPVLDAKLVPEKKFDIAAAASSRRYIPIENKTGNFNGFLTGFIQIDKYLYLTDNYWLPIIGKGKHLYLQALATDILDNKDIITDPAL